jgi:hypothetical protein
MGVDAHLQLLPLQGEARAGQLEGRANPLYHPPERAHAAATSGCPALYTMLLGPPPLMHGSDPTGTDDATLTAAMPYPSLVSFCRHKRVRPVRPWGFAAIRPFIKAYEEILRLHPVSP